MSPEGSGMKAIWQADGPLVWFVGWTMLLLTIAAFVVSLVAVARGPNAEQTCLDKGGSWSYSHVLSQPETQNTYDHYNDTQSCTVDR